MPCRPNFSQRSSYNLKPRQSKNSSRLVCFSMSVLLKTCWSFHIWFLLGSRNCKRSQFSPKKCFQWLPTINDDKTISKLRTHPRWFVTRLVGMQHSKKNWALHGWNKKKLMLAFGWLASQKSLENEPISKVTSHFSCAARWSTSLLVTLDHNRQQMDTLIMNFGVHR